MVYEWKVPMYRVPANVAGAEIEACMDAEGVISPASVVERAAPETNPLHGCFEWDNDKAAGKWREQEARTLIGNLVTVFAGESESRQPITVRAFVNTIGRDGRGYKNIVTVLGCDADRERMLATAMQELTSFKTKYASLSELAEVFGAIDRLAS